MHIDGNHGEETNNGRDRETNRMDTSEDHYVFHNLHRMDTSEDYYVFHNRRKKDVHEPRNDISNKMRLEVSDFFGKLRPDGIP